MAAAARAAGGAVRHGGTYLCMEGPQFSTRAESHLYRQWNCDIIGMTNWQEAKLAREAELCFASLALVTDYDCWNSEESHVVIEEVLRILHENVDLARRTVVEPQRRFAAASLLPLRERAARRDHHRSGADSVLGAGRSAIFSSESTWEDA